MSQLQSRYYASMAAHYDAMHVSEVDEHGLALRYMLALVREFNLTTVLDVGTGTGRAVSYLRGACPDLRVVGIEPEWPLLARAVAKPYIGTAGLASASGYRLPFLDASFDAVCQFGVLHHVQDPNVIVDEMMRVARRAVFLSDSNRFGQGSTPARWLKLALSQFGLWPLANFLKTHGAGYTLSEGDGQSYSYSVFDSHDALHAWADRILLVPTGQPNGRGWLSPLLTSSHVLLCAIRDR